MNWVIIGSASGLSLVWHSVVNQTLRINHLKQNRKQFFRKRALKFVCRIATILSRCYVVGCRNNAVRRYDMYIYQLTYRNTVTAAEHKTDIRLTKDTPYHALTGELWCVCCGDCGENWPRYNGTALYEQVHSTGMWGHVAASRMASWYSDHAIL